MCKPNAFSNKYPCEDSARVLLEGTTEHKKIRRHTVFTSSSLQALCLPIRSQSRRVPPEHHQEESFGLVQQKLSVVLPSSVTVDRGLTEAHTLEPNNQHRIAKHFARASSEADSAGTTAAGTAAAGPAAAAVPGTAGVGPAAPGIAVAGTAGPPG